VTISTNMAGRGTDIRLGGSSGDQHRQVAALGGLYVLGTHRHDSKRIDDQLRGRAGRQGDPGSSRFFSSLDDDLLQRHGIERLLPPALRRLVGETDGELSHPAVEREVARAQRIADGQNGDIRRRLFSYSQVLETQRRQLDEERRQLLEGRTRPDRLAGRRPQRWAALAELAGEELLERVERRLTLLAIDRCWSEHLTEMEALRDEVHLVQLDGRDPLTHYYRLAAAAYGELPERIEQTLLESFDRLEITADGVDWEAEGLRGPSSTWTYMVSDQLPGDNTFLALATHASFGLWSVLILWPLLLLWGLGTHLVRWRRRRKQRDP
jgi:preprotein translocase subunit SecA